MKLRFAKLACLAGLAAVQACEFECEPPQVACRALEIDVIFALDDSGSMSVADWVNQREFTKQLATGMNEKFGGTRMGLVQWGSDASAPPCPGYTSNNPCIRVKLDWKATSTVTPFDNFLAVLGNLKKSGGMTPTEDAFDTCGLMFESNIRTAADGSAVQQLCIVVTDGGATYPGPAADAALALKTNPKIPNVRIMMVGVGSINSAQIELWASEPKELYKHVASDFTAVITVTLPQIIASVCFFVGEFDRKCAVPSDNIKVIGSGFVRTGIAKCVFKAGSQTTKTDATIISITEATCPAPQFQDEESVPPVLLPDPLHPPPNYFSPKVYSLEIELITGATTKISRNNNLIQLLRSCAGGSEDVSDDFNPFDPGAPDGKVDGDALLPPTEDPGRATREVDISAAASLAPGLLVALLAAAVSAFF